MSKSQEEYIRKRFEALEEQGYRRGQEACRELLKNYALAKKDIEKEIDYWFKRIGENNNVSMAGAKQLLTKGELQEFKWSLEEYIEKAKDNGSGKWSKELENASAKIHINRLEALKTSITNITYDLAEKTKETTAKALNDVYENTYYRSGFEIQKMSRRLEAFSAANKRVIEKAIEKPWTADGRTFSSRLWREQDKLVAAVDKTITKGLTVGSSVRSMTADLTSKIIRDMGLEVDKARRRAETIVRTETARINVEAALDSMEEIGCEKVQIVETLDMTTCEECGSYDGNVVELKDAVVGKDVPPFHPNCRGCTVPYYDDPYFKKGGKRAARDPETGKTVLVEDMTYKEWKEKYVKEHGQKDFDLKQKSTQNMKADVEQYNKYKSVLGKNAPKTLEEFQKIKYNDNNKWNDLKYYYKGINKGYVIKNAAGDFVIKVSHTEIKARPNSITQVINKRGGIDRNYYDADGKQIKQISNHNHGNPKMHPFGKNGEHAHDYIYYENKNYPDRPVRELSDEEKKENGDIL